MRFEEKNLLYDKELSELFYENVQRMGSTDRKTRDEIRRHKEYKLITLVLSRLDC